MIRSLLILGLWAAPNPAPLPEEGPPSLELLEFLGQFETVDGEWLDPLSLDQTGTTGDGIEDDENDDEDGEDDDAGTDRPVGGRPGLGH